MATTTRLMTAQEFHDFVHRPENADRWFELDEGELIEVPSPKKPHGLVCGNVTGLLWNYTRQWGQGYVCSNDTGVLLEHDPDTVRGPDVAVYRDTQTFDDLLAEPGYSDVPPLLVVEILSPSDRFGRVTRKVMQYLNAGVELVWVLDPEDREVTVYRRGAEPAVCGLADTLTGGNALPDLGVAVADLFRKPGEA